MTTRTLSLFLLTPLSVFSQTPQDAAPLKYWPAPLYWQPTRTESAIAARPDISGSTEANAPATSPANSLVFVGMTPCRLADTRTGFGFTGAFGPPGLTGNVTRSFPLLASSTCSIPSIAQAYSLNITVVPPGPMYYLTIWPMGLSQPNVSTLNDLPGAVIANAAIVPAGSDSSGSVNVFVSNNTDLIIDINGYYAPQNGISLTQGTAGAPSLSFANDPGTGIYSSAAGTVNIATGGTNRIAVGPNGGATITGTNGDGAVVTARRSGGDAYIILDSSPASQVSVLSYRKNNLTRWLMYTDSSPETGGNAGSNLRLDAYNDAGNGISTSLFVERETGNVGIGTDQPAGRLEADSPGTALLGVGYIGVEGVSDSGDGVFGRSDSEAGAGVFGETTYSGYGVYGSNFNSNSVGYAGYFSGRVEVTGNLTVDGTFSSPSDARLKQQIEPLNYGLPELLRLRPVSWKWKAQPEGALQLGLVAQDVERVLPELVHHDADPDQPLALNYLGLVPVSIKAIQEQQAQIADQKREIESLKALVCLDHPAVPACR